MKQGRKKSLGLWWITLGLITAILCMHCAPKPTPKTSYRPSHQKKTHVLSVEQPQNKINRIGQKPKLEINYETNEDGVGLGEVILVYPGLQDFIRSQGDSCNNYYAQYEFCPVGMKAESSECSVGGQRGLYLDDLRAAEEKRFIWDAVIDKSRLDFHSRICQFCQSKEICSDWFNVPEPTIESQSLAADFKKLDQLEYKIRLYLKTLYQGLSKEQKKTVTMEDLAESYLSYDFDKIPQDIVDEGLTRLNKELAEIDIRDANTDVDGDQDSISCISDQLFVIHSPTAVPMN